MGSDGWNILNKFLHRCFGRICSWLPVPAGLTPRMAKKTPSGDPSEKKFSVWNGNGKMLLLDLTRLYSISWMRFRAFKYSSSRAESFSEYRWNFSRSDLVTWLYGLEKKLMELSEVRRS